MSGDFPAAAANGAATATVIDFFGALITPKATTATTGGAIDVAEQIRARRLRDAAPRPSP